MVCASARAVARLRVCAAAQHTMFGPDEVLTDFLNCDPTLHGIVPRASDHLFDGLRHGKT